MTETTTQGSRTSNSPIIGKTIMSKNAMLRERQSCKEGEEGKYNKFYFHVVSQTHKRMTLPRGREGVLLHGRGWRGYLSRNVNTCLVCTSVNL